MKLKWKYMPGIGQHYAESSGAVKRKVSIWRGEVTGRPLVEITHDTGFYRLCGFASVTAAKAYAERAVDALDALEGNR